MTSKGTEVSVKASEPGVERLTLSLQAGATAPDSGSSTRSSLPLLEGPASQVEGPGATTSPRRPSAGPLGGQEMSWQLLGGPFLGF